MFDMIARGPDGTRIFPVLLDGAASSGIFEAVAYTLHLHEPSLSPTRNRTRRRNQIALRSTLIYSNRSSHRTRLQNTAVVTGVSMYTIPLCPEILAIFNHLFNDLTIIIFPDRMGSYFGNGYNCPLQRRKRAMCSVKRCARCLWCTLNTLGSRTSATK